MGRILFPTLLSFEFFPTTLLLLLVRQVFGLVPESGQRTNERTSERLWANVEKGRQSRVDLAKNYDPSLSTTLFLPFKQESLVHK